MTNEAKRHRQRLVHVHLGVRDLRHDSIGGIETCRPRPNDGHAKRGIGSAWRVKSLRGREALRRSSRSEGKMSASPAHTPWLSQEHLKAGLAGGLIIKSSPTIFLSSLPGRTYPGSPSLLRLERQAFWWWEPKRPAGARSLFACRAPMRCCGDRPWPAVNSSKQAQSRGPWDSPTSNSTYTTLTPLPDETSALS